MPPHAPARPPLLLPRGLLLFTTLWLIGSWLISFGPRTPVHPSSATYTPSVQLMTLCITIGLMVGWPMLRLSQRSTAWPIRLTILDMFTLFALVQIVIWPMRLITNWPPERTAAIDATITGWLLLVGAIIASALTSKRAGPRSLAMISCLCLCLLGPMLAWLGVLTGADWFELVALSPLMAVKTLGEGGGAPLLANQWRWIILLLVAATVTWVALVGYCYLQRRCSSTPTSEST